MNENQSSFEGWARVEVMGHQTHIGYVKTEAYGGAVLFRVDSPGAPEREYTLESPEMVYTQMSADGDSQSSFYCPKGTVVKRVARPPVSVLIGSGSIYRIIPCDEPAAMRAIEREQRSPIMLVSLSEGKALPSPEVLDDEDNDLCGDCGLPFHLCRCKRIF